MYSGLATRQARVRFLIKSVLKSYLSDESGRKLLDSMLCLTRLSLS